MIYTLTFSPAVDYVVDVGDLKIGAINRTKNEIFMPGGKGINVSIVLSNLGMKSKALGFVGGFSGEFIKDELKKKNIETDFVDVDGITRINMKIRSTSESAINGMGPILNDEDINKLVEKLKILNKEDYLIISGKIPASVSNNEFENILRVASENGARIVVDTEGKMLLTSLKYNPFLIKPNKEELEGLFNVTINSDLDIEVYAKKLLDKGAKNVIVSLGSDGAILVNNETICKLAAPKGDAKNTVGAGDSLLAGFIYEYITSQDMQKALKFAIAAGSATAFSDGLASKEDINAIYKCIY